MAVKDNKGANNGYWSQIDFSDGATRYWEFGRLRLWIRKQGNEWQTVSDFISKEAEQPCMAETVDDPADVEWNRFVSGSEAVLELLPVLPDRPIIVRPASPFRILSGSSASLYLYVPVWIQIGVFSKNRRRIITEFPSELLSSSWFGDMKTGELCYSFKEHLLPQPVVPSENEWFAVCPLKIKNASQSILEFQRFCLRCVHLSMFTGPKGLFTNEIQVSFSGEDQLSQVVFSSKPPEVETPLEIITKPRIPYSSNILKKSFSFFKTLTEV